MIYFFIYKKIYKQFIQVNQPGHIGQCSANHPGICGCSSLLDSPTLPSAAVIFGVEKPVSSLLVTPEGWTIEPMMFGCHKGKHRRNVEIQLWLSCHEICSHIYTTQ